MADILITGFTPFDNRKVNASWNMAQAIQKQFAYTDLQVMEIPVIWGKPEELLRPVMKTNCPTSLIALGEGREGWFDIETLACNQRNPRPDNSQNQPAHPLIAPDGPKSRKSTFNTMALQRKLASGSSMGTFPVRRSRSAGGFLCEETFYMIEGFKEQYDRLTDVLFVHLPPYGSDLTIDGKGVNCDEDILARFGQALFENFLDITSV